MNGPRLGTPELPGGLPDAHRAVVARRGETPAVPAEVHGPDRAAVPLQPHPLLPRLGVPELARLIAAPRGQALAVGAEDHAIDRPPVALQPEGLPPAGHVPEADRGVHAGGGQVLAVGTEGQAGNGTLMGPEEANRPPLRVP